MKAFFDLLPIIFFFIVYKIVASMPELSTTIIQWWPSAQLQVSQVPILSATAASIVMMFLQIGWLLLRKQKVERMMWINLALISVLGGATLLFKDPSFIKWKPTALYWLFALTLLVSLHLLRKNLIKTMLGKQLTLPEPVWSTLNTAWVIFFSVMGALNLYVAYQFSEASWVNFKLFGGFGLMLVFLFAQVLYLQKYMEEQGDE